MRKTLMTLLAALCTAFAALAVTPADLMGYRWQSKAEDLPVAVDNDSDTRMQCGYTLTLNDDGAADVQIKYVVIMGNKNHVLRRDAFALGLEFYVNIRLRGTYTLDNDRLVITPIAESIMYELDNEDIRVVGAEDRAAEMQMIQNMMPTLERIQHTIVRNVAAQNIVLSDVAVNGKRMTCVETDEDGQAVRYTFARKKLK